MTGAEMSSRRYKTKGLSIFSVPGRRRIPISTRFSSRIRSSTSCPPGRRAVHAAEGYARSTGRVGVVLVTWAGATNAVTGLTDALMDSIPVVCITGQVPTSHRLRRIPGVRYGWHHAFVHQAQLAGEGRQRPRRILHEAFYVVAGARSGGDRHPEGRAVRDWQLRRTVEHSHKTYKPKLKPDIEGVREAVELMASARSRSLHGRRRHQLGAEGSQLLRELVRLTGFRSPRR